jgi:hypothetical protein
MRALIILCLLSTPVLAEDTPPEEDGFSLMEEGMKLVLRGVLTEIEPALDEMDQALQALEPSLTELGPKLMSLMSMIDDVGNYDFPVMLPNGDILIRRNVPLLPQADPEPGPNGEIEL